MAAPKRVGYLAVALCMLVSFSIKAESGIASRADTRLQLNKKTTVPFEYFNQHIFVTLTVNGTPGIVFLFDTGTSANILNLQTSQRLGLKPESVQKEKDLGLGSDKVSVAAAKNVDVMLGDVRVANVLAIVDLHGLEQANHHRIDGILGFPLLRHYVVELDIQKQVLSLHPAKGYKFNDYDQVIFLSRKKYSAAVPVILGTTNRRQHDAVLEIDTGSDATLLLYSKFIRQAHLEEDTQQPQELKAYGLGGFFPIQLATLRFMSMGHTELTPLTVLCMQTTPKVSTRRKVSGVIGNGILEKYQKIIFDVPRGRIILEDGLGGHD